MENKEWLEEFPSLKSVSATNPFTVPSGYFDELEQRITSSVHLDELKLNGGGFALPENYFEELSGNIQSRIAVEEFINTADAGLTVPEGYFENLQEQINARVVIEEALNESTDAFTVPEGYFDNLQLQINARILVEEALNETEEAFTVPEGYFEKLNKSILNQTVNQDMVKRKGIVRKMFASGSFKYAAAACFALIVGAGIFVNQVTDPVAEHDNSFLHKQVQTISVSDIKSYLQQDVDANDTQHTVIDENAPVNETSLTNALQGYNADTNQ